MNVEHDVAVRLTDALADLSDTMTGIRVLFEQESVRYAAERAEDAEDKERRAPIRREAALRDLRDALRGVVHEARSAGGQVPVGEGGSDVHAYADQLAERLEQRLRTSWSLRDTFRTLGVDVGENLTDIARRRAVAQLGTAADPRDLEQYRDAWLAGATYHERG